MISTCVILALAVQSAVAGSHKSCIEGCTCEPTSGGTKMTCSTTLFSNFEEQLPQDIVELYLSNQPFSHLHIQPSNVHKFSAIKTLSIKYSQVSSISDSFMSSLPSLQYFTLTYSPLKIVRTNVFQGRQNLLSVNLKNNAISEIQPNAFRGCDSLSQLHLGYNPLDMVHAESFAGLPALNKIYIEAAGPDLHLRDIDISSASGLKLLSMSHTRIPTFRTTTVITSTSLQQLYAEGCSMSAIDEDVFQRFPSLTLLSLNYNNLDSLKPGAFVGNTQLQDLYLKYNSFTYFPPDLFPPNSFLEALTLENCNLNEIHEDAFMSLRYLDRLDLNSNNLIDLPEKLFRNLMRLKHLSLSYNRIHVLPSTIFEGLSKLESLEIKNNELKIIDSTLFRPLTNLLELHIPHNEIETLEKDAFKSQTQLLDICIDNNKISKWDSQVFSPLRKLTYMKASKNEFDSWPIVSELPDLEQLYISNNAIVDIPATPEYIPKLRILHIGGNLFEYLYKGTFDSVPLEEINIGWCYYLRRLEENLFSDVQTPFNLYINENPRLCMTHDQLMSLEELTGEPIPLEVNTTDTCPPIPPRGVFAPTDRPVQTNNSLSLIAIIAIVLAAVLLIFLIILIVCWIQMKRQSKIKNTENRLDRNRGNTGNKREDDYQQRYDYPDMDGGYQGLHMAPPAGRALPVPPEQADTYLSESNRNKQGTNNSMYIHEPSGS